MPVTSNSSLQIECVEQTSCHFNSIAVFKFVYFLPVVFFFFLQPSLSPTPLPFKTGFDSGHCQQASRCQHTLEIAHMGCIMCMCVTQGRSTQLSSGSQRGSLTIQSAHLTAGGPSASPLELCFHLLFHEKQEAYSLNKNQCPPLFPPSHSPFWTSWALLSWFSQVPEG